jgi:hypothetical protein
MASQDRRRVMRSPTLHLGKALGLPVLFCCTFAGTHQGGRGVIPAGDFDKARDRLLAYARETVVGGAVHNRWIRLSAGGGTYEPPYVSVGFNLTDGSGISGLVNVATGEVKDFRHRSTLLPPKVAPEVEEMAGRAKEMLKKEGVGGDLSLFNAYRNGEGPWRVVLQDSAAFKYVVQFDPSTRKRVVTPGAAALTKYKNMLYSLGARKPLRSPFVPDLDAHQRARLILVDGGGTAYDLYQDAGKGEVASIEFEPHDTSLDLTPAKPLGEDYRAVRRVLKTVGAKNYVLSKEVHSFKDQLMFGFSMTHAGVPYFGYGGRVRLEKGTHRLVSYGGPYFSTVPAVNATKPLFKGAVLTARAKEILDGMVKGYEAKSGYQHSWSPMSGPELGYYLVPGEAKARLVWRQRVMINRHTSMAIQGGGNGIYIDALTGEHIATPNAL